MKRTVAIVLSSALTVLALPRSVAAEGNPAPLQSRASLVDAGKTTLSNGWTLKYSVYSDSETGVVSGDGYVEDPASVDSTGSAGRWLSYTLDDGQFLFLGADDGVPFRASIGPEDLIWSWNAEEGWSAEYQHPNDGPQASILGVVVIVVVAAVLLSGDSGCSCGHSGGTENHPGTNHPD